MKTADAVAARNSETVALPPDRYLLRIRDLIYQSAGIFQPDHKLRLLEERCAKRMKEVGAGSLRDYLDCLTTKPSRQPEMVALLNEITIGETYFFRNQPQLDALRKIIIPKVIKAKSKSRLPSHTLRIWSAGCSTGEEPYTLAIMLLEDAQLLPEGWSVTIQATDLNQNSVQHARRGEYGDYATRNLAPEIRQKYFVEKNGRLTVGSKVRSLVNVQRLNLLEDRTMALVKNIDIILCCNVLIYFDTASKIRVIDNFHNSLTPDGFLLLGHSESLYRITDKFCLVHMPSATAYAKWENPLAPRSLR